MQPRRSSRLVGNRSSARHGNSCVLDIKKYCHDGCDGRYGTHTMMCWASPWSRKRGVRNPQVNGQTPMLHLSSRPTSYRHDGGGMVFLSPLERFRFCVKLAKEATTCPLKQHALIHSQRVRQCRKHRPARGSRMGAGGRSHAIVVMGSELAPDFLSAGDGGISFDDHDPPDEPQELVGRRVKVTRGTDEDGYIIYSQGVVSSVNVEDPSATLYEILCEDSHNEMLTFEQLQEILVAVRSDFPALVVRQAPVAARLAMADPAHVPDRNLEWPELTSGLKTKQIFVAIESECNAIATASSVARVMAGKAPCLFGHFALSQTAAAIQRTKAFKVFVPTDSTTENPVAMTFHFQVPVACLFFLSTMALSYGL